MMTVFVDRNYDTGPIIAQSRVPVTPSDTPLALAEKVLQQEHVLFPETLQKIATGELVLPIKDK